VDHKEGTSNDTEAREKERPLPDQQRQLQQDSKAPNDHRQLAHRTARQPEGRDSEGPHRLQPLHALLPQRLHPNQPTRPTQPHHSASHTKSRAAPADPVPRRHSHSRPTQQRHSECLHLPPGPPHSRHHEQPRHQRQLQQDSKEGRSHETQKAASTQ
jgi:hypothetical protein